MPTIYEQFYKSEWLYIPAARGHHSISFDTQEHEHSGATNINGDHDHLYYQGESGEQSTSPAGAHEHTASIYASETFWSWHPDESSVIECLRCNCNGIPLLFSLNLLPGTLLKSMCYKWQAIDSCDGIDLKLYKRDESSINPSWIQVYNFFTADENPPFPITVTIYTFPNLIKIESNYCYALCATSMKGTIGVNLFSVGIEILRKF